VDGLYENVKIKGPRLADKKIFEAHPEFMTRSMNRDRWFWRWDTPEKYQMNVRAYYRMISGFDNTIGRVLGELKSLDCPRTPSLFSVATTATTRASAASPESGATTRKACACRW